MDFHLRGNDSRCGNDSVLEAGGILESDARCVSEIYLVIPAKAGNHALVQIDTSSSLAFYLCGNDV